MTLMKNRLEKALEEKNNDIKSFVWKFPKDRSNDNKQTEIRLIDCTPDQLIEFYDHCNIMLFNTSKDHPGRTIVLKTLRQQRDKIGCELMLRSFEKADPSFDRFSFMVSITKFLENNSNVDPNVAMIKHFIEVPSKYEDLTLQLVIDGCADKLGVFTNPHITRSFIIKRGLWFKRNDYKTLNEYAVNNGLDTRVVKPIELAFKYLKLKEHDQLRPNQNGLSLREMEDMLSLLKPERYKDITTNQLVVLRYRILYDLESAVKEHIKSWETLRSQIEKVADSKGVKLF